MSKPMSCFLLTSDHEHLSGAAEQFARRLFDVRHVSRYPRGTRELAPEVEQIARSRSERIDYLFNFLSPVIVPPQILRSVRKSSINFHPAPPKWPGVGSASLALYEGDEVFGATAHAMTAKVDSGAILRAIRFPILAEDDCQSLFGRALDFALLLFYDVLTELARGGKIDPSGETWERRAVTRAQFETWMRVSLDDEPEDVVRKARALSHTRLPGPYVELAGMRFYLPAGATVPVKSMSIARGVAA
jgi:methionyl-tRNA formyltransferase